VECDASRSQGVGDGYGDGNEAGGLFAEAGVGFVGVGEELVTIEGVGINWRIGNDFCDDGPCRRSIENHEDALRGERDRSFGSIDRRSEW